MHDRPIAPQHTSSPQGEHRPHIGLGRQGAVQIGAMRWLDGKASVVLRQPGRQEPIRVGQGRDARHPHFLDQPIL
jgi:hypothetical protein